MINFFSKIILSLSILVGSLFSGHQTATILSLPTTPKPTTTVVAASPAPKTKNDNEIKTSGAPAVKPALDASISPSPYATTITPSPTPQINSIATPTPTQTPIQTPTPRIVYVPQYIYVPQPTVVYVPSTPIPTPTPTPVPTLTSTPIPTPVPTPIPISGELKYAIDYFNQPDVLHSGVDKIYTPVELANLGFPSDRIRYQFRIVFPYTKGYEGYTLNSFKMTCLDSNNECPFTIGVWGGHNSKDFDSKTDISVNNADFSFSLNDWAYLNANGGLSFTVTVGSDLTKYFYNGDIVTLTIADLSIRTTDSNGETSVIKADNLPIVKTFSIVQ